jgi:hypothetical protein
MAHIANWSVKITYDGTQEAVETLDRAFKEKSSNAVQMALDYVEEHGGTANLDGRSFAAEAGDSWEMPDAFVSLGRQFPDAAFIFDFSYYGEAAGCEGDGRYYCVYENGMKVYDADNWLEQYAYLNRWLKTLGVKGNFYFAGVEEKKRLIARGRLVERGKTPEEITEADVEGFLEDFDEENSGLGIGVPCNFAEFLVDGKDYAGWSQFVAGSFSSSRGIGGYEDYREGKEAGDLPRLTAKDRVFCFDAEEDDWTAGKALSAVKRYGRFLEYVPKDLKTQDVCLAAVKQNGWALHYVPEKLRNAEVCLAAVKQDGGTLKYAPQKLRNAEMCLAAVNQDGRTLEYVPKKIKTPEVCLEAVKQNGRALQDVPEELKTPELCLAAVKQDGYALRYVPEELRTPELCLAAVTQDGQALRYVPEELRTPELCLAAVKQDGWALQYVPEALKTPEMCLAALQAASDKAEDLFEYIPRNIHKAVRAALASGSAAAAVQK